MKKIIRMLYDLGSCKGGTQVHLIAQDTVSIFSQAANQSTNPDTLFQVLSVLRKNNNIHPLFGNYYHLSKTLTRCLSNLGACTGDCSGHGIFFSQASNQSTDPDMRLQFSSVLSFPPVDVAIIRKLLSTIKKVIIVK